ncbi:MAG: Spy/CpxP family protein refolding chaperone [Burkholderiaceae bacterium]|jgi:hypothetical protein|nr:Spy/CpxP family protein refolding chaperone [Burkholderiaceae bacterium]
MNRTSSRLLLAALIAAAGATAAAQPGPASPGPGRGRMDPAVMQQRRAALHEQYLAQLKEQLKLAPEQESAWTAFVAAMQPMTPPARPTAEQLSKMTPQERAEMWEQRQAMRAAIRQGRTVQGDEAVQALRAQLTPEQQTALDQWEVQWKAARKAAWASTGGGMGPGMGGGMGPGMGGGPGPR